jgi:hypothetical protein
MEEVKKIYEQLLNEFAQKLEGATPGTEETYQMLKDMSTLNQMYLSVVREIDEAEKNKKSHEIDLEKIKIEAEKVKNDYETDLKRIDNDIIRNDETKKFNKKQVTNDKLRCVTDAFRAIISCGASIFLTKKVLKVEDEGIVKTKTLPIIEKLANKN